MVARFVCTPRGASSIPMLLVCFARRPISHMFDFHAHAQEGVSLRVLPFVSNFIADARYNTYVRFGLSTVIGFSSGDRESREIETRGVKIETRYLTRQGVDVGRIFGTGVSTRDPPEGGIFLKSRPPYATIDVRTVVFFFIVLERGGK